MRRIGVINLFIIFSLISFVFPFILADNVTRIFYYNNSVDFPNVVYNNQSISVSYTRTPNGANYWAVDQYMPFGWNITSQVINSYGRFKFFSSSNIESFSFKAPNTPGLYYFNDSSYWNYGNDNWFIFSTEIVNVSYCNKTTEVCDWKDNDCDYLIDEGVKLTLYRDIDGDGYGNSAISILNCSVTSGYSLLNGDCNDNNASIRPNAAEIPYTGVSENCSGYDIADIDRDGYCKLGYNIINKTVQCANETGTIGSDCNDNNAIEFPNRTWYADLDGDRYSSGVINLNCARSAKFNLSSELIAINGDCNDTNANVNPSIAEACNGIDDNCNSVIDDGFNADSCSFACSSLGFFYNSSKLGSLRCCGNNALEDSPFQIKETLCGDGRDNDCDGIIDGPRIVDADIDCSNCVNNTEFTSHLTRWVGGIVNSTSFFNSANYWISGGC